ncbi:MOSC domain-containing protein [Ammoniphilus sp. CFH 90114]|uniref:MOSC domain-containing protein n=1 Tax=Ammoniphilus sp. CFH 90114 TaxID=2493665 RepID=UPI00100E4369|nr:MOSC domain-containing protein [Ammoniphilus sp. CFH 90114]RXT06253.1 MOSC domain-containing protein [Ammoniphilus sp. CFH 90114]
MSIDPIQIVYTGVGMPRKMVFNGNEMNTGICKDEVEQIIVNDESCEGDGVANTNFHGGPDRVVCVYPYEHYGKWEKEFQTSLPPCAFGENLTIKGLTESEACIGDIYQVGEAVLQITQGRIPCQTISKRTGIQPILQRIVETGFTGYFFRVLQSGIIRKDSTVSLIQRHPLQVTVLFANQILFHDKKNESAIRQILEVDELASVWRDKLSKQLESIS